MSTTARKLNAQKVVVSKIKPESLKVIKALSQLEAVAPLGLLEDYPYNDPVKTEWHTQ